ncbi:hypothetical protein ACR30T_07590 [Neisseria gonorrhoeae]
MNRPAPQTSQCRLNAPASDGIPLPQTLSAHKAHPVAPPRFGKAMPFPKPAEPCRPEERGSRHYLPAAAGWNRRSVETQPLKKRPSEHSDGLCFIFIFQQPEKGGRKYPTFRLLPTVSPAGCGMPPIRAAISVPDFGMPPFSGACLMI